MASDSKPIERTDNMKEQYCEHCKFNTAVLDRLKSEIPSHELTEKLADVFKIFGDYTRIRILWTLFDEELCVLDISKKLNMSQSAISHQLRILKQARLVKVRRETRHSFYALDDDHIKKIIEQVMIHVTE